MAKILVTGATGFIGNYVIKELLKNGQQVIASSFSIDKARQFSWFRQVQYLSFDLAAFDPEKDYFSWFGAPDAMIHLAWEGLPNYKAAFHCEVNLPRHFSFLQNMIRKGLLALTVTGTCFEYGMREGILSEDMPPEPGNSYALAKDTLRRQLEALEAETCFHMKWIRLFYMYGNGQNPNSLLSQLQKAIEQHAESFNMSGGEQIRDYLPVEKVAEYIVKIALQQEAKGIINCCSGQPVTVKQLVINYLQQHNANIRLNLGYYPYTDFEPMAFWGDNKKLQTVLTQPGNEIASNAGHTNP